jgi:hypothetical protein
MPSLDTALIVLAGIALFATFVNGAIGYGFSSLTVTLAPTITRLLNRYERPSYIPSVGGKESVSIARSESEPGQKIVGSVVEAYTRAHIQLKVRSDSLVVCFDPESGQIAELSLCPLCAITRHQRATSPGRLPAPSRSADSTVTPSNRLLRPQGDGCSLAILSRKVGASAEEEINEPTGKFLRPRGDMTRLKLLASAVVS